MQPERHHSDLSNLPGLKKDSHRPLAPDFAAEEKIRAILDANSSNPNTEKYAKDVLNQFILLSRYAQIRVLENYGPKLEHSGLLVRLLEKTKAKDPKEFVVKKLAKVFGRRPKSPEKFVPTSLEAKAEATANAGIDLLSVTEIKAMLESTEIPKEIKEKNILAALRRIAELPPGEDKTNQEKKLRDIMDIFYQAGFRVRLSFGKDNAKPTAWQSFDRSTQREYLQKYPSNLATSLELINLFEQTSKTNDATLLLLLQKVQDSINLNIQSLPNDQKFPIDQSTEQYLGKIFNVPLRNTPRQPKMMSGISRESGQSRTVDRLDHRYTNYIAQSIIIKTGSELRRVLKETKTPFSGKVLQEAVNTLASIDRILKQKYNYTGLSLVDFARFETPALKNFQPKLAKTKPSTSNFQRRK